MGHGRRHQAPQLEEIDGNKLSSDDTNGGSGSSFGGNLPYESDKYGIAKKRRSYLKHQFLDWA